jgi:hypothetical protein
MLSCAEAGSSLETKFSIQGTSREKRGQPARIDVLKEIAQFTKGAVLDATKPQSIVDAIAAIPDAAYQERRLPIWAHPCVGGAARRADGRVLGGTKGGGSVLSIKYPLVSVGPIE